MDRSKRAEPLNREVRQWKISDVAMRGEPDDTVRGFSGIASVFGHPYTIRDAFGEYEETVAPGAANRTLKNKPDTAFLLNHTGLTMARTTKGTLRLDSDPRGLLVDADLDTRRSDVRDMTLALERGDVDEMSFAFRVRDQKWNDDYTERTILEFDLHRGDVSVVNFGANPATTGALRSLLGAELSELDEAIRAARAGEDHDIDLIARAHTALGILLVPEERSDDYLSALLDDEYELWLRQHPDVA